MYHQRLPELAAPSRDEVDHSGREANLLADLDELSSNLMKFSAGESLEGLRMMVLPVTTAAMLIPEWPGENSRAE